MAASNVIPFPSSEPGILSSRRFMIGSYLEEALKAVPSQQVLINMVSQRVRQLNQGHRPLVETLPRMSLADVALKEIAEGKLVPEFENADEAET
jgi:DNA-directed RNA polymerase subunit omega